MERLCLRFEKPELRFEKPELRFEKPGLRFEKHLWDAVALTPPPRFRSPKSAFINNGGFFNTTAGTRPSNFLKIPEDIEL